MKTYSMERKLLFEGLGFVALLGAIFALAWFLVPASWSDTLRLDREKEEELGRKIREWVIEGEQVIQSPQLDSVIALMEQRFRKGTTLEYNYTFTVVKSEQINAFALPGGQIVIYSGLIEACTSEGELAAVIGHEMGHAEKRHVVDRIISSVGIAALMQLLGGNQAAVLTELVTDAVFKSFSRSDEEEADRFALQLLHDAGLNPGYLADVFGVFLQEESEVTQYIPEFMMTHPDTKERLAGALEFASLNPVEKGEWKTDGWENRFEWLRETE